MKTDLRTGGYRGRCLHHLQFTRVGIYRCTGTINESSQLSHLNDLLWWPEICRVPEGCMIPQDYTVGPYNGSTMCLEFQDVHCYTSCVTRQCLLFHDHWQLFWAGQCLMQTIPFTVHISFQGLAYSLIVRCRLEVNGASPCTMDGVYMCLSKMRIINEFLK